MDPGRASNNEAELNVEKQGLIIGSREQYHRLEVEGYSAMVTSVLQKLQKGAHWEHISSSW